MPNIDTNLNDLRTDERICISSLNNTIIIHSDFTFCEDMIISL